MKKIPLPNPQLTTGGLHLQLDGGELTLSDAERGHRLVLILLRGKSFATDTAAGDWQFAPHPSVMLLRRGSDQLLGEGKREYDFKSGAPTPTKLKWSLLPEPRPCGFASAFPEKGQAREPLHRLPLAT